uniref:Uncharacterized protein n=1 Tax=Chaetoceros debilis TaxID=122233 RepID=A0A7S3V529_9STRA|mmetsp:Transcript_17900/g.27117  ORF Transcript_17900/g.27117 Transcript_17900/m.27117 type:complete len:827 (+) Transcript_17900:196-2676(+)|eukprot:CAMPEP_0194077090 /NCGR_PEP_ID=MMETSP0149-20130528/3750_1 /TAXON_ID=122233 /ORGANISM="Chaetoceros debilis, Strain MM31A-1" /LENGTH=826 /DNA_ID=CAMNT_0038757991 /DNA_START=114 /DNA_END=2594 /DNA_ORIENTATION=+
MKFKQKEGFFGNVECVSSKYSISRRGEIHTKVIDIPSPFNGRFRIDDVLEQSRHILMEFNQIYDSYYMGINKIEFYDENNDNVPYKNTCVDGEDVDHDNIKAAMPANGWWATCGEEHSLVFDFGKMVKIKEVYVWCANGASTPRIISITDAKSKTEQPKDEDPFCKSAYFQLAGNAGTDPEKNTFRKTPGPAKLLITLDDIVGILNANPPQSGFESFLSTDGKNLFVFYAKGAKTRALNYYFGEEPEAAVKLARSISLKTGVAIDDVAKRSMTLEELRAVRAIIVSKCVKKKWKSSEDRQLRPEDVNMYDFNFNLVKPITKKKHESLKELFDSGDSSPTYYVSHWFGGSVLDLINSCESHAMMHDLDASEAKYWVYAFANRHLDVGSDIVSDPSQSSFNRAMELAKGVLLIVDPKFDVVTRIWVNYELHRAVHSRLPIDVAIFNEGAIKMIVNQDLPNETTYQKRRREQQFPCDAMCDKFFQLQLHQGKASLENDKIRILNVMVENKANLDSKSIVQRIKAADSKDSTYVKDMERLSSIDNALKAEIAEKAISIALSTDEQSLENFFGHNLVEILGRDTLRKALQFDDLMNLNDVDDRIVEVLTGVIGPQIETFILDVCGCVNLTNACLVQMQLPETLLYLRLNFGNAPNITNEALLQFSKNIPGGLQTLLLDLTCCNAPDGSSVPQRLNSHLQALAGSIPSSLVHFGLTSTLGDDEHGMGIIDLAKCMPMGLEKFELALHWQGFNAETLNIMIGYLPSTIEDLNLSFLGGEHIDDTSLKSLAAECQKLVNLKSFKLKTSDSGSKGFYSVRDIQSLEILLACSEAL